MLQARGSLEELIDDLNVCTHEAYLPVDYINLLKETRWRTRLLIDGYIRHLRQQKVATPKTRETSPAHLRDIDDATNVDATILE